MPVLVIDHVEQKPTDNWLAGCLQDTHDFVSEPLAENACLFLRRSSRLKYL
jgi:hypothetical protein